MAGTFRHPSSPAEASRLIREHEGQVQRRRRRQGDGTYRYAFECPHGHRHRTMLQAVICIGRRAADR